jgi:lysophospholipid acyltransferase 1/2
MLYKYWYLILATMLIRFKYYHAWLFADAICNNSGLGFNGYNEDGTARWDLISNVDAFKFEVLSQRILKYSYLEIIVMFG